MRRAYRQRSLVEVLRPDADMLWDPTLRRIDTLLDDEALVERVAEAVAQRHPGSQRRSRLGTPADLVLRMLVLKHLHDGSFDECEREVRGGSGSGCSPMTCSCSPAPGPEGSATVRTWRRTREMDEVNARQAESRRFGRRQNLDPGPVLDVSAHFCKGATVRCELGQGRPMFFCRVTYRLKPALPAMPGVECIGRVTAVGAGVSHVAPGDLVINLQREN